MTELQHQALEKQLGSKKNKNTITLKKIAHKGK